MSTRERNTDANRVANKHDGLSVVIERLALRLQPSELRAEIERWRSEICSRGERYDGRVRITRRDSVIVMLT